MLLKDVRAHPNIVRQEDGIECFRHWSFNIPKMDGHFMAFLHSLIFTFCFSWGCSMAMLVPNAARQLVTNPPFFFVHFLGFGGGC